MAEALAEALMLPLAILRYEAAIGSFLGETASRLADIFDWARTRRLVLFFDEFDAIAKERGDEHETGEVKRIVSTLLMLIDDLPSHVVVVAASNHPELLDRAADRRFELALTLPTPSRDARIQWWSRYLASLPAPAAASAQALADRVPAESFSELEDLGSDIRRHLVLQPEVSPAGVVKQRVRTWQERHPRKRA